MEIHISNGFYKWRFWIAAGLSLCLHFLLLVQFDSSDYSPTLPSESVLVAKIIDLQEIKKSADNQSWSPNHLSNEDQGQDSGKDIGKDIGQAFNLPPSALLSYAAFVNGNPNQTAQIEWLNKDDGYRIRVSVAVPFIGDYVFTSTGLIDRFGLAPDFYEEVRGSQGSRTIQFSRQSNTVTFSLNGKTADLPNGTQDRFSVLFQLAGLVAGNPRADEEGVAREIPIADSDKLAKWIFVSQGDVQVSDPADTKKITARHFVRLPREEGDQRKLEVWLSQENHWLPLKVIQTEPNGRVFELFLSQVSAL